MTNPPNAVDEDRAHALDDLVHLRVPVAEAIAALGRFPWDSDTELVTLDADALAHVLDRFLEGSLLPQALEDWANAVEGRDDIAFSSDDLIDHIAELANPLLYRPLNRTAIHTIHDQLDTS
ncbi:MAG: hypothetical protein ACRDQ5_17000 [Sciscionella sp.]